MHKIYYKLAHPGSRSKVVAGYTSAYRKLSQNNHHESRGKKMRVIPVKKYSTAVARKKPTAESNLNALRTKYFINKSAEDLYKRGLIQCYNLAREKTALVKKVSYIPTPFGAVGTTGEFTEADYIVKKKNARNYVGETEETDIEEAAKRATHFMNPLRTRVRYRISGSATLRDIQAKNVFDAVKRIKIKPETEKQTNHENVSQMKQEEETESVIEEPEDAPSVSGPPRKQEERVKLGVKHMTARQLSENIERNVNILKKNYFVRRTLTSFADEISKKEKMIEEVMKRSVRLSHQYTKNKMTSMRQKEGPAFDYTMSQSFFKPIHSDSREQNNTDSKIELKRSRKLDDIEIEHRETFVKPSDWQQAIGTFVFNPNYKVASWAKREEKRPKIAIERENEVKSLRTGDDSTVIDLDKFDSDDNLVRYVYDRNGKILTKGRTAEKNKRDENREENMPSEQGNGLKDGNINSLMDVDDGLDLQKAEETLIKINDWQPQVVVRENIRKRSVINENIRKRKRKTATDIIKDIKERNEKDEKKPRRDR